jgi:hypothetical protein
VKYSQTADILALELITAMSSNMTVCVATCTFRTHIRKDETQSAVSNLDKFESNSAKQATLQMTPFKKITHPFREISASKSVKTPNHQRGRNDPRNKTDPEKRFQMIACLSVYLFVCLSVCRPVCLYLSTFLPFYLSTFPSLSLSLSFVLSVSIALRCVPACVCLCLCVLVCACVCLCGGGGGPVCLQFYLPTCLYVYCVR